MGFNWKAIHSYDDAEVALYRLLGEMLRRKATLGDLDHIRAFLLDSNIVSDGWEGLGEALHRTTTGSPVGYDIWLAWLRTYDDVEVEEERLAQRWAGFGEDFSEAAEDLDPDVDVLPAAQPRDARSAPLFGMTSEPHTADDVPSVADEDDTSSMSAPLAVRRLHTGVLSASATQLLQMVPAGPFTLRLFERVYPNVDEYTVLTLIKRGLFPAAEVAVDGKWLPAWRHGPFQAIGARMRAETERILSRASDDDVDDSVTDQMG